MIVEKRRNLGRKKERIFQERRFRQSQHEADKEIIKAVGTTVFANVPHGLTIELSGACVPPLSLGEVAHCLERNPESPSCRRLWDKHKAHDSTGLAKQDAINLISASYIAGRLSKQRYDALMSRLQINHVFLANRRKVARMVVVLSKKALKQS